MAWPINPRPAKSIVKLRQQVDALAPNRNTSSDGMKASGDHTKANPNSDHEPWVRIGKDYVVTAIDITHDPRNGCDCNKLVKSLIDSKDRRVKYIIWNRQIISGTDQKQPAWKRRPYNGKNPHDHHFHLSVKPEEQWADATHSWSIDLPAPNPSKDPVSSLPLLKRGSRGPDVELLQRMLGIAADGRFGPATERAVKAFQNKHGLVPDGKVGMYTWEALQASVKMS